MTMRESRSTRPSKRLGIARITILFACAVTMAMAGCDDSATDDDSTVIRSVGGGEDSPAGNTGDGSEGPSNASLPDLSNAPAGSDPAGAQPAPEGASGAPGDNGGQTPAPQPDLPFNPGQGSMPPADGNSNADPAQPNPGQPTPADEQNRPENPGALSCIEIVECINGCAQDQACAQSCVDGGSPEAVRLLNALAGCLQNSGCAQEDAQCQQLACGAEIQGCVDQAADAGQAGLPADGVADGYVCCGDAGAACDLDVEVCCSNWFGKECKAQCDANLDLAQTCDGAEDCADGQICCALPDAVVPTSFAATCRDACNANEQPLEAGLACGLEDGGVGANEPAAGPPEPDAPVDEDDVDDGEAPGAERAPGEDAPEADGECTLVLRAEARGPDGACEACARGTAITLVALVENPCDIPLTYRSERDCIVSEFTVLNMESQSSAVYPMTCRQAARAEEIAPGGSISQSRPAGRLSSSQYQLSVQFEDAERTRDVYAFTID